MNTQHPLAPEHLPGYLPGADGSDPLFTLVVVLILILALVLGVLYFKLHALPERMAHRQNSTQLQLIAVLAILALLTHNNVFWVGALLLAVVRFPDFKTPIDSIDQSLKRLAGQGGGGEKTATAEEAPNAAEFASQPVAGKQQEG